MRGNPRGRPSRVGMTIPWLVFTALVVTGILLVTIATLILSGILVHWMKDSHYTTNAHCDDGNVCTRDLELEGGCDYKPRPNGYHCNSQCFYPEPAESFYDDHRCEYQEYNLLQAFGPQSVCTGTLCKGDCELTTDCPDISFAEDVGGTSFKDCDSNACYYTLNATDLNNDINVPCDRNSPAYVQVCLAKLNVSDPIVEDDCLVTEPVCSTNGPLSSNIVACYYFFRCARPTDNVILLRSVEEEERTISKKEEDATEKVDEVKNVEVKTEKKRNENSYEDLANLVEGHKLSNPKMSTLRGRKKLWDKTA